MKYQTNVCNCYQGQRSHCNCQERFERSQRAGRNARVLEEAMIWSIVVVTGIALGIFWAIYLGVGQ